MNSGDEIFELVDGTGRVTGRATRRECHSNPALTHRSVHVFVLDGEGRIYLQKRSAGKDIQPGRWDSSVGGHLAPGEDHGQGAAREMEEELGIKGELRFLYRYLWRTDRESELVETYLHRTDREPLPDAEEIEEGRFFTLAEVDLLLAGDEVTPNLREEIRRLRAAGIIPPIEPLTA